MVLSSHVTICSAFSARFTSLVEGQLMPRNGAMSGVSGLIVSACLHASNQATRMRFCACCVLLPHEVQEHERKRDR